MLQNNPPSGPSQIQNAQSPMPPVSGGMNAQPASGKPSVILVILMIVIVALVWFFLRPTVSDDKAMMTDKDKMAAPKSGQIPAEADGIAIPDTDAELDGLDSEINQL